MIETASTQAVQPARKKSQIQKTLGYVGVFLAGYFIFLILTFPYDLLIEGAMKNYKDQVPAWLQPVEFESVSPDLPLGAKVKGLSMGKGQTGAPLIEAESLTINAGLFKAITGKLALKWKASLAGGKLQGSFNGTSSSGKLITNFAGLKIEEFPLLTNFLKMDISGKLTGKVDLDWSKKLPENKGSITLKIDEGAAKQVNLKVITTDFQFTSIEGEAELENGVLTINRLVLEGTPSGFELTGTIRLNTQDFGSSSLDLNLIFTPTPEFESSAPFGLLKKEGERRYKAHLGGTFKQAAFP